MATESGSKAVDAGRASSARWPTSFKQIAGLVATTTEAAREIELCTKQQATAVEQVNVAVAERRAGDQGDRGELGADPADRLAAREPVARR